MPVQVVMSVALLYASRTLLHIALSFLTAAPVLSLRFWFVNVWVFTILTLPQPVIAYGMWVVAVTTHAYARRAFRVLWLVLDFAMRGFVPAMKVAARIALLTTIEHAGVHAAEAYVQWLRADSSSSDARHIPPLVAVVGLCTAASVGATQTIHALKRKRVLLAVEHCCCAVAAFLNMRTRDRARQRDRETEKRRDRETERQRDRERERKGDRRAQRHTHTHIHTHTQSIKCSCVV